MTSHTLVIFVLYCVSSPVFSAYLKKELCKADDIGCLTDATKALYPVIISGVPGKVEPSDPLIADEVTVEVPDIKYVLSNPKMTGLLKCTMKDLHLEIKELSFTFTITCPIITIESEYETEGQLDGTPVKGKGASNLQYRNCDITMKGNYEKIFDKSGDVHTQVTTFETEINGEEAVQDYKGLCFGEKECDGEATEEQMQQLETRIRRPLMDKFIHRYVNNLNAFLKIVPLKDIHYKLTKLI